jgi:bifunctional non-homologous end joining protein LigD
MSCSTSNIYIYTEYIDYQVTTMVRIYPMLLARGSTDDIEREGWVIQRKYDGSRIIAFVKTNLTDTMHSEVKMHTRSWLSEVSNFYPEICTELRMLPSGTYDAELAYFKEDGEDVMLTVNSPPGSDARKGLTPKLMIFDILELNGVDTTQLPFEERQHILVTLLKDKGYKHIEKVITITKNKSEYFAKLGARGLEGAVLKKLGSKYQLGDGESIRSKDWLKVKFAEDVDVVIIGTTEGNNRRAATFGALILGQYDKTGKLVYVGKTSGFKDDVQLQLIEMMKPLITDKAQVRDKIHIVKDWVQPVLVAKVKCMERTDDNKLRNPAFIELRTDKTPAECVLDEA